jgi:hypothetical protein
MANHGSIPCGSTIKFHSKKRVVLTVPFCKITGMNDYERIARIIRYLDAHHADQPNLTALARLLD